jgi:hypothetical protein
VAHTTLHRHKGLKGLLSGDLAARAISDPNTGKALACLRQRARQVQQPIIYRNFFTDKGGTPPSATKTKAILRLLDEYIQLGRDPDAAFKIDTIIQTLNPT